MEEEARVLDRGVTPPRPRQIREWYNPFADVPFAVPPPRNSEGGSQLSVLDGIVPRALQHLGASRERYPLIPSDVTDNYAAAGRPTPLTRASNLERRLGTRASIYFKREDLTTTGSFKLNTALAQASAAKKEGYTGVVTETGAGQWALALAAASAIYGLKCRIFQARCSFEQKPIRRELMALYGAEVIPSPSDTTEAGRALQARGSFHDGSIGTAISEAIEFAQRNRGWAYLAGSNLPFVYVHQSIIGREALAQLAAVERRATTLCVSVGGGSNLAGFVTPFLWGPERAPPGTVLACESAHVPRLTRGEYRYDHGDPAGLTPQVLSFTLGMDFVPPPSHTGGLRQHNGSPLVGVLVKEKVIRPVAFADREVFTAGRLLAETEGIVAAPETCHAVCGVLRMAEIAEPGDVIVSCISGAGAFDLAGYRRP
jgi:pyridoxal-phosphate dependent TrpB-like enzyme